MTGFEFQLQILAPSIAEISLHTFNFFHSTWLHYFHYDNNWRESEQHAHFIFIGNLTTLVHYPIAICVGLAYLKRLSI